MRSGLLITALFVLAGCSPDYPMDKPGTWSLNTDGSSNDANLRAMVANPEDLVHGQGEDTAVGPESARPVQSLYAGKRAPLPDTNSLDIMTIGSSSGSGGSGAGQ